MATSLKKVAVVTGSNKGIGYAIVKGLCAQFDGDVILAARDESRGLSAVKELEKIGLKPKFHQLDIDDERSIEAFEEFLKKTYGKLNILVNNAAIAYKVRATEPFSEQAEVSLRVNFTGTLNVCNALFPLLSANARVVNVSSSEGILSRIPSQEVRDRFSDPNLEEATLVSLVREFVEAAKNGSHTTHGWPNSAYAVSKVAVCSLTRLQQRVINEKRPGENILINAVHPGYVDTDMTSHKGPLTPDEGAIAPIWAALIPAGCPAPSGALVWYNTEVVDWVTGPHPQN